MKILKYIILSAVALLLGCSSEKLIEPAFDLGLIVYLGGDNDLSQETTEKLDAICAAWPEAENGRLLVYQDRKNEAPRLLEMEGGTPCEAANWKEVEVYEEENSASAEVFTRVITQVRRDYPANRYGLLLFSHATGWLPGRSYTDPAAWRPAEVDAESGLRSVLRDGDEVMEAEAFAAAIPDGAFDFIVMEMCFSGGVELAYPLRKKADWMLASSAEIFSPGFTPVYRTSFKQLFHADARTGLENFARTYMAHVRTLSGDYRSATVGLLRTAGLDGLMKAAAPAYFANTSAAISEIQCFDRGARPHLFFDLEAFVEPRLTEDEKIAFQEALKNTVVYADATEQIVDVPVTRHCGLTTYILQDAYPYLNEAYRALSWYKEMTQTMDNND